MVDDKKLPNLKVLIEFRMKGKAKAVGTVMSKSDFSDRGDWLDMCVGDKPKLVQTDEDIGVPTAKTKSAPKIPKG